MKWIKHYRQTYAHRFLCKLKKPLYPYSRDLLSVSPVSDNICQTAAKLGGLFPHNPQSQKAFCKETEGKGFSGGQEITINIQTLFQEYGII